MPSCPFGHLILQSKGQKVPKLGSFKNEGIHELSAICQAATDNEPLAIYPVFARWLLVRAEVSSKWAFLTRRSRGGKFHRAA